MAALTHYYGRMKREFHSINPHDATQMGEDLLVTAAAGAAVGLVPATMGGLDKKVGGFDVPIDGLMSVGFGLLGLSVGNHKYSQMLKVASIAAGGSAAVRTFEKFFKSNMHGVFGIKGEFEDLGRHGIGQLGVSGNPYQGLPAYNQRGPGIGYGASAQDRLVEASRYL